MNIHELPQDQKGTRAETLNIVNTWNASLVIYLATSLSTNTGNLFCDDSKHTYFNCYCNPWGDESSISMNIIVALLVLFNSWLDAGCADSKDNAIKIGFIQKRDL